TSPEVDQTSDCLRTRWRLARGALLRHKSERVAISAISRAHSKRVPARRLSREVFSQSARRTQAIRFLRRQKECRHPLLREGWRPVSVRRTPSRSSQLRDERLAASSRRCRVPCRAAARDERRRRRPGAFLAQYAPPQARAIQRRYVSFGGFQRD